MHYSGGRQIRVGDAVIADGMAGVVVCDFDKREFLDGYAHWVEAIHLEAPPTSGVLIRTDEAGLIQYEVDDEGIVFVRSVYD